MKNGQAAQGLLDHLDYGCRLISEMYGNPQVDGWTNGDFVRLSNILYRKTRVRISSNTLKRIFGKIKTEARYYPQRATRDALAIYIGYRDWEHFIQANPLSPKFDSDEYATPKIEAPPLLIESSQVGIKGRKWVWWTVIAAAVGLVGVLFYRSEKRVTTSKPLTLSCTNPVGGNPHSAAFVVHGLTAGRDANTPLLLDFGDGRNQLITGMDSLISHYYEEPGRFFATLKYGGEVSNSVAVFLQSNGWAATAAMMYDTTRVYPIERTGLFTGGLNSISALEVKRAGVDTNRTFFVHFTNTRPTDIDADNFELTTRVKTSADRAGVRCSQVRLVVFGETSRHYIDMMKPGCLHWARVQFSELVREAKHEDLQFLGADLREGGTIRLKVVNKQVNLYINEKRVFQGTYTESLKHIYGIEVLFAGIGTVYSLQCKDLKSEKIWEGSF
jgi:hypothetical protein